MDEYSARIELDEVEIAILRELQVDGRLSNAELARRINLSPPATHARLKRLEEQNIIRRFVAILDQDMVGFDMMCFVSVSLQLHKVEELEEFRAIINDLPEVLECFHVTGEFDYLLKVIIHNRKDLQDFVVNKLTPIPGVARIYTSLVLSEVKSTTALPIS